MPREFVMVSTCPLCAGPEEVLSMVTVEIDRIIPKGRATIVICRSCCCAVLDASAKLDDPLLRVPLTEVFAAAEPVFSSDTWSAVAEIYGAFGDDPSWLKEQSAIEKEERDGDPSTD